MIQKKTWKNMIQFNHPYRLFIIRGPGSGKTSLLFNLISHQPGIDKTFLYAEDPYEAKYHC